MFIFIIAIFILVFSNIKIYKTNELNANYLSHQNTLAINGVFVLLVFFSHSFSNLNIDSNILSSIYAKIQLHMDQSIVVPFLFFSGYGISLSLKNKKGYINTLLKTRLLKLLVHFDIAVIIYVFLQSILGTNYSLKHILMSLIGWKSVGNSNWYIFVMLLLYILIILSYQLCGKKYSLIKTAFLSSIFIGIYIVMMRLMYIPPYFYNTVFTFILGYIFPLIKEYFDKRIIQNNKAYLCWLTISSILYMIFYNKRNVHFIFYELWIFFFTFILILSMSRIQVANKSLIWCGKNVFGLYILQRIPIILMCYFKLNTNVFFFIITGFIFTIILVFIFNKLLNIVDKKLFKS